MRIENGAMFVKGKLVAGLSLSFQTDTICAIGAQLPPEESFDASGLTLVPGFIDVHIHGFSGRNMGGGEDALRRIALNLARHGTTGFLATLSSAPVEEMRASVEACARVHRCPGPGAAMLGLHLEGPFLNAVRKGACRAECILPASLENFLAMVGTHADLVKLIALAPELPGALEFVDAMVAQGVRVACGHTDATYEQALEAVAHGASVATHTFNAMSPLAHRAPGMAGATLACQQLYAEFIGDFVHLHPGAVQVLLAAKGKHKAIAITDCTMYGGLSNAQIEAMPTGRAMVRDGAPRLPDGTLAGSCLTLDQSLRNVVYGLGVPLEDALPMYGENAARMLGLTRRGRLSIGCYADIVALDAALRVKAVWAGGRRMV